MCELLHRLKHVSGIFLLIGDMICILICFKNFNSIKHYLYGQILYVWIK